MTNSIEIITSDNLSKYDNTEIYSTCQQFINEIKETRNEKYPGKILELLSYLKKRLAGREALPLVELLESNYWSTLHEMNLNNSSEWNSKMLQKNLHILEETYAEFYGKVSPYIWNQICYHYSKGLMNIGRTIEALDILKKMIESDDVFYQMKEPEIGWGLIMYSAQLTSETDRAYCIYHGHQKLKRFIETEKDPHLQSLYKKPFSQAQKMNEQLQMKDVTFESKGTKFTGKEKIYRKWCAENALFINGSNDIDVSTMIEKDAFFYHESSFPNETNRFRSKFFIDFLNSLSQEFITIRWLLFDTLNQPKDKMNFAEDEFLREIQGPNVYSVRTDLLKTVYRMSYSIFDKIAYFLNHYLSLNVDNHKTNLNSIWFMNEDSKKPLKDIFKRKKNDPLKALYWLSRDIYGYDKINEKSSFVYKANYLRNMMEHSYLQITEIPESILNHESGITLNLDSFKAAIGNFQSHNLSIGELEEVTLEITKKTRNALLYLKYAIDIEESRK